MNEDDVICVNENGRRIFYINVGSLSTKSVTEFLAGKMKAWNFTQTDLLENHGAPSCVHISRKAK